MKIIGRIAIGLGLSLALFTSCDDDLSRLGESVQTPRDIVESEQHNLQFEARTVEATNLYNGNGTEGLLGGYSDNVYGNFKADFVSQLRTAPGFSFSQTPINGTIDSVVLRLSIPLSGGFVGLPTTPMQISVYEVPQSFNGADFSTASLAQYADENRLLGERMITIARDTVIYSFGTGETIQGSAAYINLKLKDELGQRFYNATRNNPEYFNSQESFNRNILNGLYITTTTGQGVVMRVQATNLMIYYRYMQQDSVRRATESFINTKLTGHADGISNAVPSSMLESSSSYLYSKGPVGTQVAITLPRSEMERLLSGQGQDLRIGTSWTLADTQMRLEIDNPDDLRLNPPAYMMLMPQDSVSSYFRKGLTERTAAATSYLSTPYSSSSSYYNFYNISRLLTEHLRRHARFENNRWQVDTDLELRVLPVERYTSRNENTGLNTTTAISEYLFPSFVRLKKDQAALKIGVVVSIFK